MLLAPPSGHRNRGRFCAETVQRVITDSYGRLAATARITTHLVVLAERLAERVDALARIEGAPGSGLPGCCSSAATTPGARNSPRPGSPTAPRDM
ncbi:three-helix bundle dimerization domain-containing protein [Streptomyces sp. NPDC057681]|uniref:three-helix bundle dimerization domain-containing protein n=1 Tax=unclassified Streptomyces TaxID=2593676 RepID=UPI0036AFDE7B